MSVRELVATHAPGARILANLAELTTLDGVLVVVAPWSAASLAALRQAAAILPRAQLTVIDIELAHGSALTPLDGWGETFWFDHGKVVHRATGRDHDYAARLRATT